MKNSGASLIILWGTASRAHTANDGAGQRGLSAPGRPDPPELYEPLTLLRRSRASDAPNPGQLCEGVSVPKTRWRRAQSRAGRGRADLARTDNRDSRSQ